MRRLRIFRIWVEVFVLSFILLSLMGFLPPFIGRYIEKTQIIPLFISAFSGSILLSLVILAFILMISFIFGRVYCSHLCPLGAFQDGLIRISSGGMRNFSFKSKSDFLRYFILLMVLLAVIFGGRFLLGFLDPFSFFGKINTFLIKPGISFLNNGADFLLRKFDLYLLSGMEHSETQGLLLLPFILLLSIIIYFSFRRGRLYCNSICPVGTFLGLLSTKSLYKIQIDGTECTGCGICENYCKAECIDSARKEVDNTSCIRCFNCLPACPESAISFTRFRKDLPPEGEKPDFTRRRLIAGGMGLIGITGLNNYLQRKSTLSLNPPSTPPGSENLTRYTERCTSCYTCVENCPTRVLQPSSFHFGLRGAFVPMMDYRSGFCDYECTVCGEVCPTEAILQKTTEEKKQIQIGTSKLNKNICVVYSEQSDCGACSEHCPTNAVSMVPYSGFLQAPEIDNSICVGCGACEYACPTEPVKAIRVIAKKEHGKTSGEVCPPEEKEQAEEQEGFPF